MTSLWNEVIEEYFIESIFQCRLRPYWVPDDNIFSEMQLCFTAICSKEVFWHQIACSFVSKGLREMGISPREGRIFVDIRNNRADWNILSALVDGYTRCWSQECELQCTYLSKTNLRKLFRRFDDIKNLLMKWKYDWLCQLWRKFEANV